jgi:hypothetical protein
LKMFPLTILKYKWLPTNTLMLGHYSMPLSHLSSHKPG